MKQFFFSPPILNYIQQNADGDMKMAFKVNWDINFFIKNILYLSGLNEIWSDSEKNIWMNAASNADRDPKNCRQQAADDSFYLLIEILMREAQ